MKSPKKKRTRSKFSNDFKKESVRLWQTGTYSSIAALAKELNVSPHTLKYWLRNKKKTRDPGLVVLRRIELAGLEGHLEEVITASKEFLKQEEFPADRATFSLQLIDRLTELRKNVVILPGKGGEEGGSDYLTQEDLMAVMGTIPIEAQEEFLKKLKETKKL